MQTVFELKGFDRLRFILLRSRRRSAEILAASLYQEGQVIFAKSQRYTPRRYGVLRASGYITPPTLTSLTTAELRIGYGGAAAPYAIWVHERVYNRRTGKLIRHASPTRARFLSTAVEEAQGNIDVRLARRMRGLFAAR